MNNKSLKLFLFCLTVGLIQPKILAAESNLTKRKIGVILALTGPLSTVGKNVQNNIILSKNKFDPNNEVELVFEDDQFQAKHAVSAAEKLIAQDKVQALITFGGGSSASVSKVAEARKTPLVAITSLEEITKSKSFVYILFMSTSEQIQLLTENVKSAGYNKIALVTTEHEALNDYRKKFVELNKEQLVADEQIIPGDLNINSIVTKVSSRKPDAIALFALPPQLSVLSRQLRAQGFKGQFFGGPPMFNPPEISAAAGALKGAWLPAPKGKELLELREEYFKIYHEPLISEGIYGRDAIKLLIEATKTSDANSFLNQLQSFNGTIGIYPKTPEKVFSVPSEIAVIQEDATLLPLKK